MNEVTQITLQTISLKLQSNLANPKTSLRCIIYVSLCKTFALRIEIRSFFKVLKANSFEASANLVFGVKQFLLNNFKFSIHNLCISKGVDFTRQVATWTRRSVAGTSTYAYGPLFEDLYISDSVNLNLHISKPTQFKPIINGTKTLALKFELDRFDFRH